MNEVIVVIVAGGIALVGATTETILDRQNKSELAANIKTFAITFLLSGGVTYAISKYHEVSMIFRGFGL